MCGINGTVMTSHTIADVFRYTERAVEKRIRTTLLQGLMVFSATQTGFRWLILYIEQKKLLACKPEFSVEFSAPPEFSGGVKESVWAQVGPNLRPSDYEPGVLPLRHCSLVCRTQWHSLCSLLGFSSRISSYRKPNFPAVSGSYLPGFSGRICSYWQPNFRTVSGSYLPGFSGRTCSYWQVNTSGRICSYLPVFSGLTFSGTRRPGFSGLTFSGTRRPGFSGRICCFWPGFSVRSFSGMGNLKKTLWAAGKLFRYLQREFLSLMREFSGGKLKQKGFFHSVALYLARGKFFSF